MTKSKIEMQRDASRIKLPRIREALGSTPLWKKDSQERESRSITPVPLFLLLPPLFSRSLFLYRPPKITRVRLALVASMTKVGRPGPELRGPTRFSSSPRRRLPRSYLYKWFFIHAAFCSRVRERGYPVLADRRYPPSRPLCPPDAAVRRPSSPSAETRTWRCTRARARVCEGAPVVFHIHLLHRLECLSGIVSAFLLAVGIHSARKKSVMGRVPGASWLADPLREYQPRTPWWNIFASSSLFLSFCFSALPLFPSSPSHWWIVMSVDTSVRLPPLPRWIIIYTLQREYLRAKPSSVGI